MANDYTDASNIKALLQRNTFGTAYDSILATLITVASRSIDAHLRREPGAFAVGSTSTRYFDGRNQRSLFVGEIAAAPTAVAVAEGGQVDNAAGTGGSYTSWDDNDYYPWPENALAEGIPYTYLEIPKYNLLGDKVTWYPYPRGIKVTAYFGFSTTSGTPAEITMATEIQTVRLFKRAQQAYEDAGAIQELNQMRYVKKLDPQVEAILAMPKFAMAHF